MSEWEIYHILNLLCVHRIYKMRKPDGYLRILKVSARPHLGNPTDNCVSTEFTRCVNMTVNSEFLKFPHFHIQETLRIIVFPPNLRGA